ncbi:MAG: 50S ribosomal protein L18Ae [Candidatus Hadarchaeota archaeon]
MKIYRVKGRFPQGMFNQKFTRELASESKEHALEKIYSEFGSKHKLKRKQISIDEVAEIKPEEATDPAVLAALE